MYNILIVEDEILIANLLKIFLENNNFNCVGIAIDFETAIEIIENQKIDLVLLDITIFGDKNGIDLAKYINKNYKIPFMYLTSHSDKNTLENLSPTEPIAYLSKPFKEIDIITSLNLYFNNQKKNTSFKLVIGKTTYSINLEDMIYSESEHVYSNLYFKDKKLLIRQSLTNLIKILPENTLIKISRSIAVNPKFIDKVNINSIDVGKLNFKITQSYKGILESLKNNL